MNEPDGSEKFDKNSAAGIFNEMARLAARKNSPEIDVHVASVEEQVLAQAWLAEERTQNFIEMGFQVDRKSLGVVVSVTQQGDRGASIQYLDDLGMSMSFFYSPGAKQFVEAPNGFKVGDIILNEFSFGIEMKSVKPVVYPPEIKQEIIRKFQSIWKGR